MLVGFKRGLRKGFLERVRIFFGLHHLGVRHGGRDLEGGGEEHGGAEAVEGDLPSGAFAEGTDFPDFGDAAGPADVWLEDVDGFGFHHVFEVAEALLRFTADEAELRNGLLQALVSFDVFERDRLFEPANAELRELSATFDGSERIPGGVRVDEEAAVTDDFLCDGDTLIVILHGDSIALKSHVVKRIYRAVEISADLDLRVAVALLHVAFELCAQLVEALTGLIEAATCVGRDAVEMLAEELRDRLVDHLSEEVPEGDVDAADAAHDEAAAAVGDRAPVHGLPDFFDCGWIAADQHRTELLFHDDLHRGQWRAVGECFADAEELRVSFDFHEQRLPREGGRQRVTDRCAGTS